MNDISKRARGGAKLLVAVALATTLAACGRRGETEPPPDPSAVQKPAADAGSPTSGISSGPKKRVPLGVPKTPFLLDPLL